MESLIGKAKQLEGRQSKGGLTKTVLGWAASVAQVTEENIRATLKRTIVAASDDIRIIFVLAVVPSEAGLQQGIVSIGCLGVTLLSGGNRLAAAWRSMSPR